MSNLSTISTESFVLVSVLRYQALAHGADPGFVGSARELSRQSVPTAADSQEHGQGGRGSSLGRLLISNTSPALTFPQKQLHF